MPRNPWEGDSAATAAAVAPGNADATRKAMFPTIAGNLWMSRGEEAWTTDSAGIYLVVRYGCVLVSIEVFALLIACLCQ